MEKEEKIVAPENRILLPDHQIQPQPQFFEPFSPILLLSPEILFNIFSNLDISSLLACRIVCSDWKILVDDNFIWKIRSTTSIENEKDKTIAFSQHLIPPNENWRLLFFHLRKFSAKREKYLKFSLLEEGIRASTTDHPKQSISETLDENESTFWSSKGSSSSNSEEYLIYRLKQKICIVSSVTIKSFRAYYQLGQPVYPPQFVKISVGFHPDEMHWSSEVFRYENNERPQTFHIFPLIVVGGFIRLDFFGKYQTQSVDNLWYVALEKVQAFGAPLGVIENDFIARSTINYAFTCSIFQQEIKKSYPFPENKLADVFFEDMRGNMASAVKSQSLIMTQNHLYQDLVQKGKIEEAIQLIKKYPFLRNDYNFELFKKYSEDLTLYFNALIRNETCFTKLESFELTKFFVKSPSDTRSLGLIIALIRGRKLTLSRELGDYLFLIDPNIGLIVFAELGIPDKIIECLKILKQYSRLIGYAHAYNLDINYETMLKEINEKNHLDGLQFAKVLVTSDRTSTTVSLSNICKIVGVPPSFEALQQELTRLQGPNLKEEEEDEYIENEENEENEEDEEEN